MRIQSNRKMAARVRHNRRNQPLARASHHLHYSRNGKICFHRAVVLWGKKPMCVLHDRRSRESKKSKKEDATKDQAGTATNPRTYPECHLLGLPLELRLDILRFVFPCKLGVSFSDEKRSGQVLRVNRQLHEEASAVLYGETIFHIRVQPLSFSWLDECWKKLPLRYFSRFLDNDMVLLQPGDPRFSWAPKMRNINIELFVHDHSSEDVILPDVCLREQEVIQVRDTARKLVALFNSEKVPKRLTIRVSVIQLPLVRDNVIALARLFLEPFEALYCEKVVLRPTSWVLHGARVGSPLRYWGLNHEMYPPRIRKYLASDELGAILQPINVDDDDFQTVWAQAVYSSTPRMLSMSKAVYERQQMGKPVLSIIERITRVIAGVTNTYNRFLEGLERAVYFARVAFDNADLDTLHVIWDEMLGHWLTHRALWREIHGKMGRWYQEYLAVQEGVDAITDFSSEAGVSGSKLDKWDYREKLRYPGCSRQMGPKGEGEGEGVDCVEDWERRYFRSGDREWTELVVPC